MKIRIRIVQSLLVLLVGCGLTLGGLYAAESPQPVINLESKIQPEKDIKIDSSKLEVVQDTVRETEPLITLPSFAPCSITGESIERDLTLYFLNDNKKKIDGVPFAVKLVSPKEAEKLQDAIAALQDIEKQIAESGDVKSESQVTESSMTEGQKLLFQKEEAIASYSAALESVEGETYKDDDSNGVIYIDSINAGKYVACYVPVAPYDAKSYTVNVNVKDKIEYVAVETIEQKTVAPEAAGDAQPVHQDVPVEQVPVDTVEYLDSRIEEVPPVYAEITAVLPKAVKGEIVKQTDAGQPSASEAEDTQRVLTKISAPGDMQMPETTETFAGTQIPESTEAGGSTQIPDSTEAGGSTQTPDSTETGGSTQAPDSTEAGGSTQAPENTEAGGSTQTPDSTEAGGSTQAPDSTEAGGSTQIPEGTEAGGDTGASGQNVSISLNKTATLYSIKGADTLVLDFESKGLRNLKAGSSDKSVKAELTEEGCVITVAAPSEKDFSCKVSVVGEYGGNKTVSAVCEVTVKGSMTQLLDVQNRELYLDTKGTIATLADYKEDGVYYYIEKEAGLVYYGWQNLNKNRYYYDKEGNVVKGTQIINGAKYNFGSDGVLLTSGYGIDVSKWQGNINWAEASTAVSFAIIRCGFRGTSGNLAVDNYFERNIKNAKANGVKVGVYFYSRAVNEVQAVEEASLAVSLVKNYGVSLPVYIDMEDSSQLGISNEQRNAVINAFCQTVQNSGYSAGVYANKNWLTNYINAGALPGNISIWCAQYNKECTYKGRYDIWQYSSKGSVPGIKGNVDMNISYF